MCLWGLDWGYILTWRSWTLCWSQFGEFKISIDWVYPLKVATKATKSKTNSCPFLQKEISTQEQYCSTWSQHPTPATQHAPLPPSDTSPQTEEPGFTAHSISFSFNHFTDRCTRGTLYGGELWTTLHGNNSQRRAEIWSWIKSYILQQEVNLASLHWKEFSIILVGSFWRE